MAALSPESKSKLFSREEARGPDTGIQPTWPHMAPIDSAPGPARMKLPQALGPWELVV